MPKYFRTDGIRVAFEFLNEKLAFKWTSIKYSL